MHIYSSNITTLFVVMSDNKIVIIATKIKDLISELKRIETGIKNRNYFSEHFNNNEFYYFQNPSTGKQYTIQKIINEYKL